MILRFLLELLGLTAQVAGTALTVYGVCNFFAEDLPYMMVAMFHGFLGLALFGIGKLLESAARHYRPRKHLVPAVPSTKEERIAVRAAISVLTFMSILLFAFMSGVLEQISPVFVFAVLHIIVFLPVMFVQGVVLAAVVRVLGAR